MAERKDIRGCGLQAHQFGEVRAECATSSLSACPANPCMELQSQNIYHTKYSDQQEVHCANGRTASPLAQFQQSCFNPLGAWICLKSSQLLILEGRILDCINCHT